MIAGRKHGGVVSSARLHAGVTSGLVVAILGVASAPACGQILDSKRGFADTGASYGYLQAVNANWYHTWGLGLGSPGGFDALHVPMFRWWTNIDDHVSWVLTRPEPTEWVMCYNEPERSSQDNLTPSEAISRCWQIANGLAGSGILIASPAVSDDGTGQAWLADFMSQANSQGLQIDGVCFHWYGVSNPNDPVGAANSFLSRVDSYHNSYGKPVWISEFAIHDWGGAYTDEEIRAANATFLRTAIPGLQSRSYVAGYAFYNWFGDSSLVEGSPLTPTNVGVEYVGVLESGDTYDFAGTDLGEHVAYLGGGELTHNSTGGVLNYISALSGTSKVSGSVDWSLDGGNWVRVQPGATLQKTGGNVITWQDTDITNEGVIEVSEGELLFDNCDGGTSGTVRVEAGATAAYDASRRVSIGYDVELDGGTVSTALSSGITFLTGSSISGGGVVDGNLLISGGALLQIGGAGLPVSLSQFVIDDFEGYATGLVRDVASPPWTAHGGGSGTMFAAIETDSSNKVLSYGYSTDHRGASRPLPDEAQIEEGEVATFFFRFKAITDDPDHNFGLGDQADTGDVIYTDYEAQIRLYSDSNATSGTYGLDARNGGSFVDLVDSLTTNTWYNLWMVIDQGADTFDVYLNTGTADASAGNKLNASPLAFRNGTTDPLAYVLALAGPAPVDYGVRIDELTFMSGVDLTNPLGGLDPQNIYLPATVTCNNNVTLYAGATLELGVLDETVLDTLEVAGQITAAGTLDIVLSPDAPTPQHGDSFDLIDAASITGAFATVQIDPLGPGYLWDMRELYTTGVISVLSADSALDDCIACLTGPGNAILPGCELQDQDGDNDVDMYDYANVVQCVSSASGRLEAGCLAE